MVKKYKRQWARLLLTNSILARPTKLILTLIALGNNFVEWVYGWQGQVKGFKYTQVQNHTDTH